jgi:FAD/FMN-containing dehydrogenase
MRRPDLFRGLFRDDAAARAVYSESAAIGRVIPRAVAVPADADDVVTLARWSHRAGVPLTARGSGSSMANGAIGEGVIVDLSRLDWIEPADREARSLRCGPGAVRDTVDLAARTASLTFPVDPSSGPFCTVGGMCATNAAGARSVKYGATRAWVRALDCVFADGSRAWVRRGAPAPRQVAGVARFLDEVAPRLAGARLALAHDGVRKESSGYALAAYADGGDLADVLVGSEGTLALIVGVELALAPVLAGTASVFATFGDLVAAARTAADCAALGASAVELLDRTFLDVVGGESSLSLPQASEAALIIEAEGASEVAARRLMSTIADACRAGGATHVVDAPDKASEDALWRVRHAASPILSRLDPNLASMQLVEDGAVRPEHFPAYVRGVREIFARHRLRCVIFGHAGDAHAHVNAMVDVRERDWRPRADAVLADVTSLVSSLGGTIAAEHGDGRLRTPLLARVWSPIATELFAATKRAFDPAGTLNPGIKVPLAGQHPLGDDVKYDPSLPPLAKPAREALDTVTREKGWGRFRLALLE